MLTRATLRGSALCARALSRPLSTWSSSPAGAAAALEAHRHVARLECLSVYHHAMASHAPHCVASGHALDVTGSMQWQTQTASAAAHTAAAPSLPSLCLGAVPLAVALPLQVQVQIQQSATASLDVEAILADSVKRKRAKKMNKHKYKKRLKEQRRQSRKNQAQ